VRSSAAAAAALLALRLAALQQQQQQMTDDGWHGTLMIWLLHAGCCCFPQIYFIKTKTLNSLAPKRSHSMSPLRGQASVGVLNPNKKKYQLNSLPSQTCYKVSFPL
jgi:hypothetical protein